MKDTFKTLINGIKFWTENMLKKSVADWNQNDPTSPDYVKNRLAWTDDPVETVLFDGTVVNDDLMDIDIELIVGQEYVITLDGVEYVLTAQGIGHIVFIGSESLFLDNDYIDTEPPFVFGIYDSGSRFYTINGEYEDEHSLKIVADIAEIHKLDEKYLPVSIAVLRAEINSSEDYLRLYMNDELLGDVPRDEYVSLESSVFHQICDMVGDGKLIGFLREKSSTSELTYNAILTCSKHSHIIRMNVFLEEGGTTLIQIARESGY